ncbi:MAG: hypothetical protein ACN0LA_13450, partial [Candidatus Longimicrobiales bacterium M2_2A_002]
PDHLVAWIRHRFEAAGVRASEENVRLLCDRAGPVTEYVVRLARVAYRMSVKGGVLASSNVDRAFEEIVADYAGSFELIWDGLSRGKRQILRAVAAGEEQLTARAVMDRWGLGSSAAATYSITQLRHDGLLAPGKPFRISDPYFGAWVRAGIGRLA